METELTDYAEPLIKAKQALKDYEQAVLDKEWRKACDCAANVWLASNDLLSFASEKLNSQP